MRAYEVAEGSEADSIALVERDEPTPGPRDAVVAVKACSLNYRDLLLIKGGHASGAKALGVIPLSDGAGEVVAVGDQVSDLRVGDRVAGAFMPTWLDGPLTAEKQAGSLGGSVDGMLAERVVLPANGLVTFPEHMSFAEAATLPCAGVTAWHGEFVGGDVKPGSTVLLLGTGGVSILALQFAKLAGAKVIITSSSDEKLMRARELGAEHTINYRENPDWQQAVLELTGGVGVDLAVEVGGPGTLNRTMEAVRFGGSIALIGVLTGLQDTVATGMLLRKSIRVQGIYVGSVRMFQEMNRALALHRVQPVIDRSFDFEDAPAALRYLQSGRHFGKVVIETT